jgi:hypothetical protein
MVGEAVVIIAVAVGSAQAPKSELNNRLQTTKVANFLDILKLKSPPEYRKSGRGQVVG